jgi:3-keto-disaccharide hydrolase
MVRKIFVIAFVFIFQTLASGVATAKPKWQVLFDGKTTASWRGFRRQTFPEKCWVIESESLKTVAGCDKSDQIDILTLNKYKNFEFELEWRVDPGANSGIIYLVSEDEDQTWKTGPEMQVLDDDKHPDGKIPKTSAGSLFALIAPANKTLRPVGEYNQARLVVRNGHVEHWLNGKKVLEYDLASDNLASLIAQSKFKTFHQFARMSEGHIALQFHGDNVWYRNVRVREIDSR